MSDPMQRTLDAALAGYAVADDFRFTVAGGTLTAIIRSPVSETGLPFDEEADLVAHRVGGVEPMKPASYQDGTATYTVPTDGLAFLHAKTGRTGSDRAARVWIAWKDGQAFEASEDEAYAHRIALQGAEWPSLPPLEGTTRQIVWAQELRGRFAMAKPGHAALDRNRKAAWWISQRYALGIA